MKRTWIQHAWIVNEGKTQKGGLVIKDKVIDQILKDDEQPSAPVNEQIDAEGLYLLPGVIDEHVHFRDPGLTYKADIHSESIAAAAGGVTSFMDMPNTNPQTTTFEALENKFSDAATKSIVNYSFYLGATNTNADLLSQLDKQRVCGVKLFMGASTGNMLVDRMEILKQVFQRSPVIIAAHCEEQSIIKRNTDLFRKEYGDDPDICYHPLIRSEEACYHSSALAVKLAKEYGSRLHIMHVSTAKELNLFEDKPLEEKKITAEATVSHLYFCNKDYKTQGTRIKCNPAIKSETDRDALRKALRTNIIDTIGTDHAPHLLKEKQGGALKAASGMPMIQFSLSAMLELVYQGILSIEQVVQKMAHAPASLYQVKERGFIRKGYKADLVLVDLNNPWTVTSDNILSKCRWSPMEGQTFHSKVMKTFCNGHQVFDGTKVDEDFHGEELRFVR